MGNFAFSNYDGQSETNGAGLQRRISIQQRQRDDIVNAAADIELAPPVERTSEERDEDARQLARQLTRASTRGPRANIFECEPGSDLDPNSDKFNARKWVKGLAEAGRESGPGRTSGIAYKNMSVHGFGSDAGESFRERQRLRLTPWGRLPEDGREHSAQRARNGPGPGPRPEAQSADLGLGRRRARIGRDARRAWSARKWLLDPAQDHRRRDERHLPRRGVRA